MKISLFYQHVTVLDYAFWDEHVGPVGHSQVVDVEFIGETNEEGVLYDFSYAKKKVKEIIDRDCDHRFVVPKNFVQRNNGIGKFTQPFGYQDTPINYIAPEEGYCEIPFAQVNDSTLCAYLEEQVLKEMPKEVKAVKLSLRSEQGDEDSFFFNYTHGLKDHYGNCQRLIHGHRSTLEVAINGERRSDIERVLCHDIFNSNIHFCYWENVLNKDEVKEKEASEEPMGKLLNCPQVKISYTSSQGEFTADLPGKIVYIISQETTVENLSTHFCQLVQREFADSGDIVQVSAFEGIGKGATTTLV